VLFSEWFPMSKGTMALSSLGSSSQKQSSFFLTAWSCLWGSTILWNMRHHSQTTQQCFLCSVDRASRYKSCKWQTWCTVPFFCMFISILNMFRATPCLSSGESVVSIRHLVCVTLCRWPSSMQVGKFLPSSMQVGKELPNLHTRWSEWHIPDVVLIQVILLMMSMVLLETCRVLK
jgi:hypothetical protein